MATIPMRSVDERILPRCKARALRNGTSLAHELRVALDANAVLSGEERAALIEAYHRDYGTPEIAFDPVEIIREVRDR